MSPWGWKPERSQGIWRHGAAWTRPLVASAPWLTILVLLLMMALLGDTLISSKGVVFDLPDAGVNDAEPTRLVAMVIPSARETMVLFDDARYLLGDHASEKTFVGHLADRLAKVDRKTLLTFADRNIPAGDLMRFTALAKKGGAARVLFAEKRNEDAE